MDMQAIPTPSYVIDEEKLEDNCQILSEVARKAGCKILLAQKAYSAFATYPLIRRYLSGATASGLYEARLGQEEMKGENHVFSPAYSQEEMAHLVKICDHIIFNSLGQLNMHRQACMENGVSMGLRINPECSTGEHGIYDPCAPFSRLGVTRAMLDAAAAGGEMTDRAAGGEMTDRAVGGEMTDRTADGETTDRAVGGEMTDRAVGGEMTDRAVDGETTDRAADGETTDRTLAGSAAYDKILSGVEGLHIHTLCEQNADALEITLRAFCEKFDDYLRLKQIKWLNLGGGHHITKEDYDRELLIRLIREVKEKYDVEVYLEPGEAIALNAGYLVTTVMDIVENGMPILILDASAACHMPDVIEMPYTPPLRGAQIAVSGESDGQNGSEEKTAVSGESNGQNGSEEKTAVSGESNGQNGSEEKIAVSGESNGQNGSEEKTAGNGENNGQSGSGADQTGVVCRLASRTCLAGDIIGDYRFEILPKIGDRLVFEDMAIYSMVKNNTFNGMPLPSIYLMHESGECELIREFSYEDFKGRLS